MAIITTLPSDVLILILRDLLAAELASLSRTCHTFNALVTEFGWTSYLRENPRPSFSLSRARTLWSPKDRVRDEILTDRAWLRLEFIARPLSRPWTGKLQPILAISPSRLAVAAGNGIHLYIFGDSKNGEMPSVHLEGSFSLIDCHEKKRDITGIAFVNDGGMDQELYVGFRDGTLDRISLTSHLQDSPLAISTDRSSTKMPRLPDGDYVECLSSDDNILLSLSSSGVVNLMNSQTSEIISSPVELKSRSWVSHLCMHSSGPYAAFGTSSASPLAVHSFTDDRLSSTPSAILYPNDNESSSAVYGLTQAPIASPWGSSPQILVSGWFDGQVRCYDLRSSSRADSRNGPSRLRPVLSLSDPWSFEAIYSVSCGGGSASHIAAGSARHSVVSFWDVRSPSTGWSVHAPGNDPSPVYSVTLESSRLFGATQSRPFVYDFGPGATFDTYPNLPQARGIDGLKTRKGMNGPGYYVTKYAHSGFTSNAY